MPNYIAALYVNGKVVTGTHHGDAYSKLKPEEKNSNFCSGFFDARENRFICEDEKEFYVKKIIMIRHADADMGTDPGITEKGRLQVQQAASFVKAFIDLKDFKGYCSPMRRCQETAHVFCNEINLDFDTNDKLVDCDEPPSFFVARLKKLLSELPNKSFLISHCNFIANMAQLATGTNIDNLSIPNCSITFIENLRCYKIDYAL